MRVPENQETGLFILYPSDQFSTTHLCRAIENIW